MALKHNSSFLGALFSLTAQKFDVHETMWQYFMGEQQQCSVWEFLIEDCAAVRDYLKRAKYSEIVNSAKFRVSLSAE